MVGLEFKMTLASRIILVLLFWRFSGRLRNP